jgi:hypothetical protein
MLEGEVDMDLVREVWEAEIREEVWAEAREEARAEVEKGRFEMLDLFEQGYSVQQIRDMLASQQSTRTIQS